MPGIERKGLTNHVVNRWSAITTLYRKQNQNNTYVEAL